MMTNDVHSSSPAQDLRKFLNELPSPFRQQLLFRLYMFFQDEVELCADQSPDEVFELILESKKFLFHRTILVIGALDYVFSQKVPWSPSARFP